MSGLRFISLELLQQLLLESQLWISFGESVENRLVLGSDPRTTKRWPSDQKNKNGPLIDGERDKRVGTGFDDPEFKTDLTDIIDKEDNECLFAFYNIFKVVNYLVILGVSYLRDSFFL